MRIAAIIHANSCRNLQNQASEKVNSKTTISGGVVTVALVRE
ncbi:hypothetical protein QDQ39_20725 [Providencia rettgeri]|nr:MULTISPECIES: hypothetical protein [Providencia]MDH2398234.1 hypothetical protein [Providencia rettgeri]